MKRTRLLKHLAIAAKEKKEKNILIIKEELESLEGKCEELLKKGFDSEKLSELIKRINMIKQKL